MDAPVLVCVEFAQDGTTCAQTQWQEIQPTFFPPMSAADGALIGGAIFTGLIVLWASKLPRRA